MTNAANEKAQHMARKYFQTLGKRKAKLEKDIADATAKAIGDFCDETGVSVTDVSLTSLMQHTIGGKAVETLVHCDVTLGLGVGE